MSSILLTVGHLRAIAEAATAKGHTDNNFVLKIIDAGPEIVVRDTNDMLLTSIKKAEIIKEKQDIID